MHWLGRTKYANKNMFEHHMVGNTTGSKRLGLCGSLSWASIMGFRFKLTWTFISRTLSSQKLYPGIGHSYCEVSGYAVSWGLEGDMFKIRIRYGSPRMFLGVTLFKSIGV